MTEQQLIEKIFPLYESNGYDKPRFLSELQNIEACYNDDVKSAFERASLRVCEARDLKSTYPAVSDLLCYIAIETLANTIKYYEKTKEQKSTDFAFRTIVEKNINKTAVFMNFINTLCPEYLKSQVDFKHCTSTDHAESSRTDFKDFLRYLYVKNRCYIVHKGISRYLENDCSYGDIYIDSEGKKCMVSMNVNNNDWLIHTVLGCCINFLKTLQGGKEMEKEVLI